MSVSEKILDIVKKLSHIATVEGKKTGFSIGNTTKVDANGLYFTPLRNSHILVLSGVIVYSEAQAIEITKLIDGKVDYILADAEKKVPANLSLRGADTANIERAIRETIQYSKLWVYKGNDIAVDALDALLTQLTTHSVRGIGGKKVTILGAGNLGSKVALKLVERGAHVTITRRDKTKLNVIVEALNHIKPSNTVSLVKGEIENETACLNAEILIGATDGVPVITPRIVSNLAANAIIIDVGKGALHPESIDVAEKRKISIYRLDITAAFLGMVYRLWMMENIVEKELGRKRYCNEDLVSGGLLGRKNEVVVDNVWNPTQIYGIADGKGDFIRDLSEDYKMRLENLQRVFSEKLI